MASGGAGGYYHGDRYGYGYSRQQAAPSPSSAASFHVCLFLATASLLGAASLYSHCESAMESLVDQLRVAVVLSPFILLLAAQYWSATGRRWRSSYSSSSSSLLAAPTPAVSWEQQPPWYDQRQRDGGASSPWGVALALALVLLLISYQSCFQYWWSPVVRRRR
ncbi:hypothetical protein D1007_28107 [Hordeum vulgare]|uniref:Predicted protein n=1 Tax=Hordeum vulgare subsp. vulgare TaxID=112509 RepID=F2DG60_HORVV|nr:uncharacterized protein LOC123401910 [Hordeum vulgare subsp. vulgare]KAE8796810.1 hypothetical protein D1007_28107 [Hordeum vulgare]KAI4982187.1 hypothetical protein ZWY2020_022679 [Hordeum vulgare]BAJ94081.1 predicted protein [Hordeum vulgare subsp. vulgare]